MNSPLRTARHRPYAIFFAGVVTALLIAVVVIGFSILGRLDADAAQEDHDRIVAICQADLADPYGRDLTEMTECIAELAR